MTSLQRLFVSSHRFLYRSSGGRIGSRLAGIEHLLLTTTGRRSGVRREHPLACFHHDGELMVVASNGGADAPPAWYLNLQAEPKVEIQLGASCESRVARTADAAERARLWPELVKLNKAYRTYERRTSREIPIVILEPTR
jgi:deazaflavin-dependent oxidoreductase (nitroreductase family)